MELVTADSDSILADSAFEDASGYDATQVDEAAMECVSVISARSSASILSVGSESSLIGGSSGATLLQFPERSSAIIGGAAAVSALSTGVTCSPDQEQVICPEIPDPEEEVAQAKRVDFITDNLLYRGEADPGKLDSESAWRIRRITIGSDNDVTEEWANGDANYNKIWDNRLSYAYS